MTIPRARASIPTRPAPVSSRRNVLNAVFTHGVVLVLADLLIGLAAYVGAWLMRMHLALPLTTSLMTQQQWYVVSHPWAVLLLTQVFLLYIMGLYDDLRLARYREVVAHAFFACLMQVAAIASLFYFTQQTFQTFPRTVILIFSALNFVGLCAWRGYVKTRLKTEIRRTLVVGQWSDAAQELIRDIEQSPWMGMEVIGLVGETPPPAAVRSRYPLLGNLDQIDEIVVRHRVDDIIFASQPSWRDAALDSLSQMQGERNVRIAILPSVYEMVIGKLRHINIHDTPLIEVKRNPNEPFERFVKRSFDMVGAGLLLIVLLPLLAAVSVAVALLSRGSLFYRQERVGYGGKVFRLIKFRTMVPDAERGTGATYAALNDPRITWIGKLLRRTRLDELPQLLNVLKGDMSFVGPRPERPGFVEKFVQQVPGYSERHKVKPGITGLAQVRGYYHTRAENKLKYDLAYIYNYSFSLDLMILLETLKVVVGRRGN